jgi:hypothetical protein
MNFIERAVQKNPGNTFTSARTKSFGRSKNFNVSQFIFTQTFAELYVKFIKDSFTTSYLNVNNINCKLNPTSVNHNMFFLGLVA